MGYDCASTLTIDGRAFRGTAVLEHKDLVFRGDIRLTIPLAMVEEVHVREDDLFITFGGRRAVFTLGADAGKWARRISHPPARAEKLGIKSGMRVALIGLDDPALIDEIDAKGASVVGGAGKELDLIFFAAAAPRDLERLPALPARLKPAGAVWLLRAKGRGAPISEAESMAAGKRAGLVDVKVVSYSDTHSAEKYVIPVAQRTSPRTSPAARRSRASSSKPAPRPSR
jgi:hypothetical protein